MSKISLDDWKKDKGIVPEQEPVQEPTLEVTKKASPFISKESLNKTKADQRSLQNSREHFKGFQIGNYIQTPPMLFSRDGHNLYLGDKYRGSIAFLVLSGPSLSELNLDLLKQSGVLTMGVNNSPKTFRPNLWLSVDQPQKFLLSIWKDPTIEKFVPMSHSETNLFDSSTWREIDLKVGQCPNVSYFRRNETFQAKQFLFEDTFNYGNHANLCNCGYMRPDHKKTGVRTKVCPECGNRSFGARSVLLPAMRMLYFLGVRTIFLLGCDFHMEVGQDNYHFEQSRSDGMIKGNNNAYDMLSQRLADLNPIFKKYGLNVFNCNEKSKLKVFPKVSFVDAVNMATSWLPKIESERTKGLYERKTS